MGVSPEVRALINAMDANLPNLGGDGQVTAEELRQEFENRSVVPLPEIELAAVADLTIPTPDGQLPARRYTAQDAGARPDVLVYFHGGGWVVGDLDSHDRVVRRLTQDLGVETVSVDYRLAPEHPYPAAVEDAHAAVCWVREELDPPKLVVGGDSAGGNVAAAVSVMARDRGGPVIDHQLLIYPVIDCDFSTPSYTDNAKGYFLTRGRMEWYWEQYVGDHSKGGDCYASPLRADDHAGLPPASVLTAEFDPLRDEGNAYAAALSAAGVPTDHLVADGMFHGFFGIDELLPEAAPPYQWAVESVRKALA